MSRRRSRRSSITNRNVYVYQALKTPQFWLIWWVLCLNVTAGIGVLGPSLGDEPGDVPGPRHAVAAAGFVGLMSLFNMGGRFFWASISDYIGRKNTYFCFFVLGIAALCARALYRRRRQRRAVRAVLRSSSSACMAAALPRFRPICATCSAPAMSAPFTAC